MKCLSCGNESTKLRFRLPDYEIVECNSCGVMFNATFFGNAAFRESLFGQHYYDDVQSKAFEHRLERHADDPSLGPYREYLAEVERHVKPGHVLDVGCAFGTFLKVASERGWTPHGVDLSSFAVERARATWGFDVRAGLLEDAGFTDGTFDLVTFWDSIEHVENPRRNLEKAWRLLREGGFLLVTTDNYRSLMSFLADTAYRFTAGRFTYPVRKFYIRYNSCYFTPSTFGALVQGIGFVPIHSKGIDYPLDKLDVSGLERLLVRCLYGAGSVLGMHSQFLLIARKPAAA